MIHLFYLNYTYLKSLLKLSIKIYQVITYLPLQNGRLISKESPILIKQVFTDLIFNNILPCCVNFSAIVSSILTR